MKRKCSLCEKEYYAKGYCKNHYMRCRRNGTPDPIRIKNKGLICKVDGCDRAAYVKGICNMHYQRLRNGGSYEKKMRRGENHWSWKGGVSEYPDHNTLKKNRLIKLREVDGKCEECGGLANQVVRKDGSKSNHAVKNLKAVCSKCRGENIKKFGKSKYKNVYGRIPDLSIKTGISQAILYKRLRGGLPMEGGALSEKKAINSNSTREKANFLNRT